MPHVYDGSLNDGFCADCDKPAHDVVHRVEPWREAWERSQRLQRALRNQGKSSYYVSAQAEYDYCAAVSKTPRNAVGPTAEEWFRGQDVPVSGTDPVHAPKSEVDLHAVRVADSAGTGAAGAAPVNSLGSINRSVHRIWREGELPQYVVLSAPQDEAPQTRWQEIAKDRGGSYWQQVQPHLWAIAFLVVGVIIGAFSVKSNCP